MRKTTTFFFAIALVLSAIVRSTDCFLDDKVEQACRTCHAGIARSIASTPHRILASEDGKRAKNSPCGCTDCHRAFEGHLDDPTSQNIENPCSLAVDENYGLCSECHISPHMQEYEGLDVFLRNEVSCSDCHRIHTAETQHRLAQSPDTLCLTCHSDLRPQFLEVSHHPVLEKIVKCADCHKGLMDSEVILSEVSPERECRSCHPEFSGPFPFEHEAVVDYTIEEGSCSSCHLPHGSSNQKLLIQPGNNLCGQCHDVSGHKPHYDGMLIPQNYATHKCIECHVDVHGSYQNEYFLGFSARNPELECLQCHQY